MLNELRKKFSERKGIYTLVSYKDRPLQKTVFSLGRSLYTSLTVYHIYIYIIHLYVPYKHAFPLWPWLSTEDPWRLLKFKIGVVFTIGPSSPI